jgi:5-methylcytosine-specific restriction endonuclease McrA
MIKRSPIRKVRSKPRPGRLKGKAMEKLRRDCFERDGYRCQHKTYLSLMGGELWKVCMEPVTWDTGHMAHIVSRGRGGKDELSNVETKCAHCHIGIEHSYGPSGVKPVPKKVDTE